MTRVFILFGLAFLPGLSGCGDRPTLSPGLDEVETAPSPLTRPKPTFETHVAPALDRHCLECHDSATKRGGIALDGLGERASSREDLETWGRVADALRSGTMPPSGRARPSTAELAAIDEWLDAEVFRCSSPDADPGRVTLRRLNRAEYNNTIRDLFDLDLHLADAFPADDVGYGFDNIGDVLSIPPVLLEKYLAAADRAIGAAARTPQAWSRIMNPPLDMVPSVHRKLVRPVRSEPVKRIGRPLSSAPIVEDPEVLALRRAYEILRGFADRAYRRPATDEELTRLVALVDSARKDGDTMDEAIRYALKAVLISPTFLFLAETEPETGEEGRSGPVNEFELAARLSYFLWSSMPDDELYRLAARGELRRGDNLAKQARRMLRDEKARALVDGFAAQWLQTRSLQDVTPDPKLFPDFDEPLRRAMLGETARFCGAIIREDRSVLEFLDADYTFVNERLARHYGIPGVVGDRFRRVSLAGTPRGGVLSHASVLTVTSNPTRTSPVKRGKWVLDNLLAMPPPPPPEGVEGLKAEDGATPAGTIRAQLERHRTNPTCASCHARMDPLGFGLENFDAIGGWRSSGEDGKPLDASGTLLGAESFRGPAGLRAVLKARREMFARCLSEKLLTYALGRGLGLADRCFVEAIARTLKRDDYRFSSLVLAIVASPPFQNRSQSRGKPSS
ncbi:Planctomycete cytochrome C [Singulisphaera sp. GP187]|uniref:DUF1592 domain-containing protein n=1 Tax=Singulisphaera sp. GP187 TaxID=1882752 RepID=UPI000926DB72|nr:DUF1592 domain-containing protein [Singulisphaera sp. GP187]SIO66233.1 Planctomycete cytochrome C [Singulisphaera sp. GP187]